MTSLDDLSGEINTVDVAVSNLGIAVGQMQVGQQFTIPGDFANDAVAFANSVDSNNLYYDANGVVRIQITYVDNENINGKARESISTYSIKKLST